MPHVHHKTGVHGVHTGSQAKRGHERYSAPCSGGLVRALLCLPCSIHFAPRHPTPCLATTDLLLTMMSPAALLAGDHNKRGKGLWPGGTLVSSSGHSLL